MDRISWIVCTLHIDVVCTDIHFQLFLRPCVFIYLTCVGLRVNVYCRDIMSIVLKCSFCEFNLHGTLFGSLDVVQESLQRFPVEVSYMPEVMKRSSLAQKIDKIARKDSQVLWNFLYLTRGSLSIGVAKIVGIF